MDSVGEFDGEVEVAARASRPGGSFAPQAEPGACLHSCWNRDQHFFGLGIAGHGNFLSCTLLGLGPRQAEGQVYISWK